MGNVIKAGLSSAGFLKTSHPVELIPATVPLRRKLKDGTTLFRRRRGAARQRRRSLRSPAALRSQRKPDWGPISSFKTAPSRHYTVSDEPPQRDRVFARATTMILRTRPVDPTLRGTSKPEQRQAGSASIRQLDHHGSDPPGGLPMPLAVSTAAVARKPAV
jgi:hypothetical protein